MERTEGRSLCCAALLFFCDSTQMSHTSKIKKGRYYRMRAVAASNSSSTLPNGSSAAVSMPIVRICASDWHSLSVSASDAAPSRGSSSLYVFLKSVPTRVECQAAMAEFRKHIASENYSSAFLRKNTALLHTVEEAVLDHLFLRELPLQQTNRSNWKRFFSKQQSAIEDEPSKSSLSGFSKKSTSSAAKDRVDDATGAVASDTATNKNGRRDEEVVDTPAGVVLRSGGRLSDGSTLVSSTTFIGSTTTLESTPSAPPRVEARVLAAKGKLHPRLAGLIADIARRRGETASSRNPQDEEERLHWIKEENTVRALRTELDAEMTRAQDAALGHGGGSTTSPQTVALRNLRKRLDSAVALKKLQRHEQQTLRMADLALNVEIGAMTSMLRDVLSATMRSEQRLQGRSSELSSTAAQSEHALLMAIQRALEDASGGGDEED